MAPRPVRIRPEQEIEILLLWAHALDIKRRFTPEEISSIRGLSEVIKAAMELPDEIGWGEKCAAERSRAGCV